MRKVIGMGETILDILFKDNQPVAAVPGGSSFNSIVSVGRVGVPCCFVGYTGSAYHAWLSVYSEKEGWIEGQIYFDGTTWKLMDPTFASSSNSSESIMQYIGNGANYSAKYLY